MFEQFSSGYYLGRLYVEPYDGDVPAIQREDHTHVNERLYAEEELVRLDIPLVMKLDQEHFPVVGNENIPSGTLALPEDFAGSDLPDDKHVLLAKPDRATELLRYAGYDLDNGAALA
ncbi:hypothetical protein GL213_04670 [Halogeometricum borinquense]|uniref:Uncharacterized protein n=1 Tax=Halogeometricum borinquense TaxID=60847 RepID=A0A6C0UI93_9EURY|nr:DUF5802 family protein [Halogeometricum borinquense]QIB75145.1 hypothetical protein G3I44_13155 [Halogeometricum borinquense]QIQ75874.1 hypothetical protein GL213_04670 [Halogeometricum borinquense]